MKTSLYIGDGTSAVTLESDDEGTRLGIVYFEDGLESGCWTTLTKAETRHLIEALEDELC